VISLTCAIPGRIRCGYNDALYNSTFTLLTYKSAYPRVVQWPSAALVFIRLGTCIRGWWRQQLGIPEPRETPDVYCGCKNYSIVVLYVLQNWTDLLSVGDEMLSAYQIEEGGCSWAVLSSVHLLSLVINCVCLVVISVFETLPSAAVIVRCD